MKKYDKSKAAVLYALMIVSAVVFSSVIVVGDENTIVCIDPASKTVSPGETFSVNVSCVPGQTIKSFEFRLSFNASLLQANSVTEGDIFDGFDTFFNDGTINNTAGTITDVYGLIVGPGSVSNAGSLVSISFTVLSNTGVSVLGLSLVGVTNETSYVPVVVSNGTVSSEVYTLTVNTVGSGSVSKNPNKASYNYNEVVTLTASPSVGWAFVSWGGDLSGGINPTTITINANKTVTATFTDGMLPVISNVVASTSTQLDTDPSFGWVNISADVTDNVAVSNVFLRITYPNSAVTNNSMDHKTGSRYYVNTTFSDYGNYSYSIWAVDNNGNGNASTSYAFSMPPNWDVNNDGRCNVFDLVLISNHYSETNTLGWIREDVDNNGQIEVLDLVLTSNEYGTSWWV